MLNFLVGPPLPKKPVLVPPSAGSVSVAPWAWGPRGWTAANGRSGMGASGTRSNGRGGLGSPGTRPAATPGSSSVRAARLRSEARAQIASGNPQAAAQSIVASLADAGPGYSYAYTAPALPAGLVQTGQGERRPAANADPYAAPAPVVQVADPLEAYRQQLISQATVMDQQRGAPWTTAVGPSQGGVSAQPRTMAEFMAALTPAQLASPEVQDLLKTFLAGG